MPLSLKEQITVAVVANELIICLRKRQRDKESADHSRRVKRKIRESNMKRDREYGLRWMRELSEHNFKRAFRMDRPAFERLLTVLRVEVCMTRPGPRKGVSGREFQRYDQATNSSGSPIALRTALAATLRWLAGGSYLDICGLFGLGMGGFYSEAGPLWSTMYGLEAALRPFLQFDVSEEACAEAAAGFAPFSRHLMNKCVVAVDGIVVRTRAPYVKELGESCDRRAYRNRKGCFGLVAIAGCRANCKFAFWSCRHTGSTHDALAIHGCAGGRVLLGDTIPAAARPAQQLPPGYYGVGDEAFANCDTLLCPWSGRSLTLEKDAFNFYLSAMRQCIERAFGQMVMRWGVFHRRLNVRADKWGLVTMVAAMLHNFCIDMKVGEPPPSHPGDHQAGDTCAVIPNTQRNDSGRMSGSQRTRRQQITDALKAAGKARPRHGSTRVRAQ
jgi:hypothetical protein